MLMVLWSLMGPGEPDCASGGGTAFGLAASTVGEFGTGKLISSSEIVGNTVVG